MFLVASCQDRYAPFHSARIELPEKLMLKDKRRGDIYKQMVVNLISPLSNLCLKRLDVNFVNPKINLDSLIGRTAHILFLDSELFAEMFVNTYKRYLI